MLQIFHVNIAESYLRRVLRVLFFSKKVQNVQNVEPNKVNKKISSDVQ